MDGIVAYGAYLPRHRLAGEAIRATLGQGGGKGTRSVAAYDEDTTSMGVEAARRARWGDSAAQPGSLHFATTAPAYADKTNATAIHAALDLDPQVFATDHGSSIRSAVGALRAASSDEGLAVLSDMRLGRPGSADEAGGGDGAAAFLFGSGDDVVAEVLAQTSATAEFLDRWRTPGEIASSTWEERFGLSLYMPLIQDAAGRALESAGVKAPDHVIVASPHARAARAAAKAFGEAAVDRIDPVAGFLGAAHAGVALADALDQASPGETVLVVSAADGADALLLRVTDAIGSRPARRRAPRPVRARDRRRLSDLPDLARASSSGSPRGAPIPTRPAGPPGRPGLGLEVRVRGLTLHRVRARARAAAARLRGMRGGRPDGARAACPSSPAPSPPTPSTASPTRCRRRRSTAAIDFDGGGRFSCELTDCEPDQVEVGTRLELTFRRMYTAQSVHNYFWKATTP